MMYLEEIAAYKLCYLAAPYSKWSEGIHMAFVEASIFAARLLQHNVKVYSPIAHTHPLAMYGNIDPLDHSIWLAFDEAIMNASEALLVAQMDGWTDSKGVQHEIEFFRAANKPIHYLPGGLFK